jgi:hypothetical protein
MTLDSASACGRRSLSDWPLYASKAPTLPDITTDLGDFDRSWRNTRKRSQFAPRLELRVPQILTPIFPEILAALS